MSHRSTVDRDGQLVPRIMELSHSSSQPTTPVSMTASLIAHYPQYKSSSPEEVLKAVTSALETATSYRTPGKHQQPQKQVDSDTEDALSKGVKLVTVPETNSLNQGLRGLYTAQHQSTASPGIAPGGFVTPGAPPSQPPQTNPSLSSGSSSALLLPRGPPGSHQTNLPSNTSSQPASLSSNAQNTGEKRASPPPSQNPLLAKSIPRRKRQKNGPSVSSEDAASPSQQQSQQSQQSHSSSLTHSPSSNTPWTVTREVSLTFTSVGGMTSQKETLKSLIRWPIQDPATYNLLGVSPARGILLHGPPGAGKSLLAHAVAGEYGLPLVSVSAPAIVSSMSGGSEATLRGLFEAAAAIGPCIVFLDEIDAITPRRETAQREMERRIVAQLATCLDSLSGLPLEKHVFVIGATSRPEAVDSSLRRSDRFDREIALGMPNRTDRADILTVVTSKMKLQAPFDFLELARKTPGFVGADFRALCTEAANVALARIFGASESSENARPSDPGPTALTMEDFDQALPRVQPSALREGFVTSTNVNWEDIGAMGDVRDALTKYILGPIQDPGDYATLGLPRSSGVLLYGPPGCGKTLVAKAIANEGGTNFISVKGPELLNKYVGESEAAVRKVFARAKASAPCVIFFDELDALAPRRSGETNAAADRVVNQLLTEMDGVDGRNDVYIIAATNRPDIIDSAMLRPGRLDHLVYVPLPSKDGRLAILGKLTNKLPLASDVEMSTYVDATDGFTSADLTSFVREAAILALRTGTSARGKGETTISHVNFTAALARVHPSITPADVEKYESMRDTMQGKRAH